MSKALLRSDLLHVRTKIARKMDAGNRLFTTDAVLAKITKLLPQRRVKTY